MLSWILRYKVILDYLRKLRMDELDSAVYYSAWNACIAETIKRFPVAIYHINDYHGAAVSHLISQNFSLDFV